MSKLTTDVLLKESIKSILTELVNSTYDWQEYTNEEIGQIVELDPTQVAELSAVINDSVTATNKVYSSQHTKELIQESLIEANKYSDELVANLSNIKLDIVDSLPDSSTVDKSTIYILKDSSGGTDNTLNVWSDTTSAFIEVGKLNVSMNNYYTKAEVDAELVDKANADEVLKPDAIVADLTTTSGSTTLSTVGLQTELDKKTDKADVVTTIDSASTDSQVPSAKAVYDKYSLHDLSEANTIVVDDALLVDPHNQNGANNKDCLVTSSSTQKPDDLLWGIRQVFWHADSDLVLKITGKDINNKGCVWINSLMPKDGGYYWQGWSKNVTSSSSEGINKLLTIKQANACTFSGETITSNSGDSGGGCVFTAPLGVKTVAFDLMSDGIFCQCGLCDMIGTLPTVITAGNNRIEFKNITTSGTYYIENIKAGSNIYIGGNKGVQISNIRITEWY